MVMRSAQGLKSEAARWFVRWNDANEAPGAKEQSRWMAWLQRSPRHVAEYFAIDEMCARLGESRALKDFDVDEWMSGNRAQVLSLHAARSEPVRLLKNAEKRRVPLRWAAAAAIVAVAIGALIAWRLAAVGPSYHTGVGEQKTVRLADGSLLQLNTKSQARVKFSETAREIELEGEALFSVAQDARRPFLVRTHDATVRAIGTRFNVYEQEHVTKVAVLEGRVGVKSTAADRSFELEAGEAARVVDGFPRKDAKPDVEAAIAWRNRTLVFERATLEEVAAEFNRYNTMQFKMDPGIDDANRLSGTFDARHPKSLLLWLQSRPDMQVERDGDVYIVREIGTR